MRFTRTGVVWAHSLPCVHASSSAVVFVFDGCLGRFGAGGRFLVVVGGGEDVGCEAREGHGLKFGLEAGGGLEEDAAAVDGLCAGFFVGVYAFGVEGDAESAEEGYLYGVSVHEEVFKLVEYGLESGVDGGFVDAGVACGCFHEGVTVDAVVLYG